MAKSIRIYQRFNDRDTLLAFWDDLPAFFLVWFAKTFSKDEGNVEKGFWDVRKEPFTSFLLACGTFANETRNNFPIREFFKFENDKEIDETAPETFLQICFDSSNIMHRGLDRNLIWKIREDTPGEIKNKQEVFSGKFLRFRKKGTDSGYGAAERWKHNAQYYVYADFDIYGFPVSVKSRLCIDVRDVMCEQNGCQRISEKLLSELEQKNKGQKIQALISYKCNDEWHWDLGFARPADVIAQLDLKRD